VDLELFGGEIHALVGQNGSGKSTLIKILSGFHTPDSGALTVEDREVHLPLSRTTADAVGLRFVHQNLGLSPRMSVLETIRLGSFATTWYGRIPWRKERALVRRVLHEVGLDLDPDQSIASLTPSQRALVAIARALQGVGERRAVLVLDEPTASLNRSDADRLFAALRSLRERGHAILFVSHRLDEVLSLADRITVIRDGRVVRSSPAAGTTEDALILDILGRDLGALYPDRVGERPTETVLEVAGLDGPTVRAFSTTLRGGEVVGVTGLGGMGHDEVPYLIFGALKPLAGTVAVKGVPLRPPTPRSSIAAGIAFLPADRERTAGVPRATVAENLTLGRLERFFDRGLLRHDRERRAVGDVLRTFEVRPPDPDRFLATLSGGNQQKALLAKWLWETPTALLLHEPTQGVDVGSRQQVFRLVRAAADRGAAILVSSAEYGDLAHLCDRVLVMRRGVVATEIGPGRLSEEAVVGACYATA
jgi:ribose transport system ATP-binding protein